MCEIYDFNTREMDDHIVLFLWDVPILIAQNREELSKLMEEKLDGILSEISPATPVRLNSACAEAPVTVLFAVICQLPDMLVYNVIFERFKFDALHEKVMSLLVEL